MSTVYREIDQSILTVGGGHDKVLNTIEFHALEESGSIHHFNSMCKQLNSFLPKFPVIISHENHF